MKKLALAMLIVILIGCSDRSGVATKALDLKLMQDCPRCPKMVVVPPGEFVMGSPSKTALSKRARPQTKISISYPLAVGQYEVTWQEYLYCLQDGFCTYRPDPEPAKPDHPVNRVNYFDALKYTEWLSTVTGVGYRLPSEAEWEYFARAGSTTDYYWGDEFDARYAYSWRAFPDDVRDRMPLINSVGRLKPNRFSLFDTIGNVREWTNDCWNTDHAGRPGDGTARDSGNCDRRILKGGDTSRGPIRLKVWGRSSARIKNLNKLQLKKATIANDGSITYSGNRGATQGMRVVRSVVVP